MYKLCVPLADIVRDTKRRNAAPPACAWRRDVRGWDPTADCSGLWLSPKRSPGSGQGRSGPGTSSARHAPAVWVKWISDSDISMISRPGQVLSDRAPRAQIEERRPIKYTL